MKKLKPYIQVFFALVVFFTLFAFTGARNSHRNVKDVAVEFVGQDRFFITEKEVNKLLIQNHKSVTDITKDNLDLNNMEFLLSGNKMIKYADVYVTIDGELKAKITQKHPLARLVGNEQFYMDDEGNLMPLSHNYTVRVPLVTGKLTENNQKQLFKLVQKIDTDLFLKENVIGISLKEQEMILSMRSNNLKVKLGNANNLNGKIEKLKVFYQKAIKDNSLGKYSWVNLKYNNQVVCTKK